MKAISPGEYKGGKSSTCRYCSFVSPKYKGRYAANCPGCGKPREVQEMKLAEEVLTLYEKGTLRSGWYVVTKKKAGDLADSNDVVSGPWKNDAWAGDSWVGEFEANKKYKVLQLKKNASVWSSR